MKKALIMMLFAALMPAWAKSREPKPEILGIRLGMNQAEAHSRLTKLGQFKSEDEGQEVWTLWRDKRYQYLIVGFDRDRRVRYVTALALPGGQPVDYKSIGDPASAEYCGTAGNVRYIWKPKSHPQDLEYIVIVRGRESNRLTVYSVKRAAVVLEDDD